MPISSSAIASPRQLYQGQPGTAAGTLYTAPASDTNVPSPYATAYITEIIICNTSGTTVTATLYVVPSGSTAGPANAIISAYSVGANNSVILTGLRTAIPPGGTLQGSQNTAGALTLTITGVEVQ